MVHHNVHEQNATADPSFPLPYSILIVLLHCPIAIFTASSPPVGHHFSATLIRFLQYTAPLQPAAPANRIKHFDASLKTDFHPHLPPVTHGHARMKSTAFCQAMPNSHASSRVPDGSCAAMRNKRARNDVFAAAAQRLPIAEIRFVLAEPGQPRDGSLPEFSE